MIQLAFCGRTSVQARFWLLLTAFAGIVAYLCRPEAPSVADSFVPRASSPATRFIGAGSCSASACHNGNFAHGPTSGSEYTFWITRDPHARAYEALFDDRSKQIQKNLERTTPAHEEQRCLRCHVAPDYDVNKPPPHAPHIKRDGVSCESCHGPAKDWLALHHLADWRLQPALEKQRLGMIDTQSIGGRAHLCARCHIGAPGMNVDHDLLAAGHPRLHFELAAFHAHLPRHWPDAKDRVGRPDFEARLWAVGQVVSAQAALQLLADRAADTRKPWPEFAEYDCSACHHDLSAKSPGKRVALRWADLPALAPHALRLVKKQDAPAMADLLERIRAGMAKADRTAVERDARAAALRLDSVLDRDLPSRIPTHELLEAILAAKTSGADAATQADLAFAALAPKPEELPLELRVSLRRRLRELNCPRPYDPAAIQKRLLDLKCLTKGG
jgi:hypothetical protein